VPPELPAAPAGVVAASPAQPDPSASAPATATRRTAARNDRDRFVAMLATLRIARRSRPCSVMYEIADVTAAPQLAQFPAEGTFTYYTAIRGHATEFRQAAERR
jgi:hypothetical protein